MPAERFGVMQLRIGEAAGCAGPFVIRLNEQGPVGLVLREALAVLLRLIVYLADRFARGQSVRRVLNARLIHEGLAIYLRAIEPDAALERGAGQMLDDNIRVMRGGAVHTGGELARG